ncbi:EthD family reductase [Sphingomonas sanxanigenens]|uniref:Ethyl tert-butyl ether degradation EthD n=1 Tax=Sphingomonas sanxanigenens DSM 19645 = NX02 TaxID=1123269 RepID=W0A7E6_9SPHN|nr:EthD family reductase [Sphingomonas sanxanigenens]AHE53006.1 ethyl tert-butyl ether degradation EthD [Sphingomonas sanxanigenens DSM 19645 = NX02]
MAVSMVVLASRPQDWTHEQFTTWWRGPHADAARILPGLIAYRHGAVTKDYDSPEVPGWDGHAVLTFTDRAALDTAFASSEWKAATAQTRGMGGRRIILITDEVDLLAGTHDA